MSKETIRVEVECPLCDGDGCNTCGEGTIEDELAHDTEGRVVHVCSEDNEFDCDCAELCSDPAGHDWQINEESDRCYCVNCGADGDA